MLGALRNVAGRFALCGSVVAVPATHRWNAGASAAWACARLIPGRRRAMTWTQ